MDNKELTNLLIQDNLKKAMKHYGIELTEEKIKKIYRNMPYLKYSMLREYNKMIHK